MRKLIILSSAVFFLASGQWSFAVDWGDSGLNKPAAPSEIYIAWEISTTYGKSGVAPDHAYFAFADKDYNFCPMPGGATPDLKQDQTYMVSLSDGVHWRTIANKVNVTLSQAETDWLFYFTTDSQQPAQVTFRCIVNNLPANTTVSVRLLTVDNQEFPITALTEGATCVVTVPPSPSPNSILAVYEIPQVEGAKHEFSLAPGWNLVGIPFLEVTDAGTLFDYPVMRCGDPAPTQVTAVSELASGASYWVFNPGHETQTVTLTGTARKGTDTSYPDFVPGWNFISPIGKYDTDINAFVPGTGYDVNQWSWLPGSAFLKDDSVPQPGVGYMVKEW